MDSNQHQQFLGFPFIYPNMDPLVIENFLKRYRLGPGNVLNAHFLYSNRNGFPKTPLEEQAYRDKFMMAADKPPTYMPLGKRKAKEGNDCECLEYENEQRMAKIPKTNLAPNLNTRREIQRHMMMAPKLSTLRPIDLSIKSRRNNPISNVKDFEYEDFVAAISRPLSPDHKNREYREFPKQFDDKMILGPYATEVDLAAYRTINFAAPKIATRQLLVLVFPTHILATHSLTGKPPTRFDNSIKMQLDTTKVDDIIHCVMSETNCKRQDVRAAITAKCCETARLLKSRAMRKTF